MQQKCKSLLQRFPLHSCLVFPSHPQTMFDQFDQNTTFFSMEKHLPSSSSKSNYLQDFHNLDHHHFQLTDAQSDPFFPIGSSSSISDVYVSNPSDRSDICANMHNFQTGFSNSFLDSKDMLSEIEAALSYNHVFPDESSCVTADNRNTNNVTNMTKQDKNQKNSSTKSQWTVEEDRVLINLVQTYGVRKWSCIAQMLKGRIGKQCRERWHNHLRPDINKDQWTEDEDRILIETHRKIGNKWAEIAKRIPGRTENSIKNHWNATKRRLLSRRKCKSKWPKPSSILQNYIKSLEFDKGGKIKSENGTNVDTDVFKNSLDYELDEVPDFDFEGVVDAMCFDFDVDLPFDV